MKWNIRLLILLLTLCTLCASAVACGSAEPAEETTVATTTTVAETTAATEPVEEMLDIVVDGKAQYAIVRDEDLSTSAAEIDQCLTILNRIKTLTNASVNLGTDWWKKGAELKSETFEILVGYTDYPETAQVISTLQYGEYAIRAVGNKIVIFGFDASSLGKAVNEFNYLFFHNLLLYSYCIILITKCKAI